MTLAHPSPKYIQQRLLTLLRFIQRVLGSAILRRLCTALFRRLSISLHPLLARWQILCKKPWRRVGFSFLGLTKPEIDEEYGSTIDTQTDGQIQVNGELNDHRVYADSTIDEQIVIPLSNIACSLHPSINEPHESSIPTSSQTLDTALRLQMPEVSSPSNDPTSSTSSSSASHISISVSDESDLPMYTTQLHFVSSPTADLRRPAPAHHRIRGYRSDSTESTERLGSGEMSSSRYKTLVADPESLHLSIDLCRPVSRQETLISSPTCVDEPETPALSWNQIFPVAPENFQRHEKRQKIPDEATEVTIDKFCTDFSDYHDVPGWSTCTHPEGGRYFHNAEKRIFTDADLYDPVCLKKIKEAIKIIKDLISEHSDVQMSEKLDLVLDLNKDDDGNEIVDYYLADHELRIVLFVDEFPSICLPHWFGVKGISAGTHLRHLLEMQYWWHCAAYPNCIELSNDLICELRAIVLHFIMDCRTSPYANSPFTTTDLQEILANTDSLTNNVGMPYSGCISFLGRLMFEFSHTKFLNFYGQPEARLNRDDSVYGHWTNRRTLFIKSISIFLFLAPDFHLRNLQKMWVDGIMHKAVWEESMKKVTDEWREFILYSTVLLNANVAFLAINSVDTNRDPYRSPAQISSYCSIGASIGGIILGLILVRQNQTKHRETASDLQQFLQNRTHPWLGLETVAIMFSLPFALLMWGMVFFLTAFWFMCLQSSGVSTRSVVGLVSGVLFLLTVWCIWTSWERPEPPNAATPERTTLSFEEDLAKIKRKGFTFKRATESKPAKRPARRSTLSSFSTTLKAPLKMFRRDTSKTAVEVSIDEKAKSSP